MVQGSMLHSNVYLNKERRFSRARSEVIPMKKFRTLLSLPCSQMLMI
jgi:hypothetical protein